VTTWHSPGSLTEHLCRNRPYKKQTYLWFLRFHQHRSAKKSRVRGGSTPGASWSCPAFFWQSTALGLSQIDIHSTKLYGYTTIWYISYSKTIGWYISDWYLYIYSCFHMIYNFLWFYYMILWWKTPTIGFQQGSSSFTILYNLHILVSGFNHILKNMSSSMGFGWHPIYDGKSTKIMFQFPPTRLFISIHVFGIPTHGISKVWIQRLRPQRSLLCFGSRRCSLLLLSRCISSRGRVLLLLQGAYIIHHYN